MPDSMLIKESADVCGINKRLTHHVARRTFAATVLLMHNIPMHEYSELLGSSKIPTNQQSYEKIVQRKAMAELKRIWES